MFTVGVFGKIGCGKSSIVDALEREDSQLLVFPGPTLSDAVAKSAHIDGIGECCLLDTAGFDDGELSLIQEEKMKKSLDDSDVAVIVFSNDNFEPESRWIERLRLTGTPMIFVVNKTDEIDNGEEICLKLKEVFGISSLLVSCKTRVGIDKIASKIREVKDIKK